MKFSDKIVTTIPLETIWSNEKEITAYREMHLTKDDIKAIIKKYPVEFVIANIGDKLIWVDPEKNFDFWKSEAETHIADNVDQINLDNFPDNYVYIASEWTGEIKTTIILLEKIH